MPKVAFFGATGGCALAALSATLEAGISATALARTPSKLQDLLLKRGFSQKTLDAYLTIVEGSVKDQAAVQRTLLATNTDHTSDAKVIVDIIISGIGSFPKLQLNPLKPVTLEDPTICADATRTILAALRTLQGTQQSAGRGKKPLFVVISTTGVSHGARDVPLAFLALYHWLLAVPHADKAEMERLLVDALSPENVHEAPISGHVSVRPSLLMDYPSQGLEKVRVGWEHNQSPQPDDSRPAEPGPAIGYTVGREDVGKWIFEQLVASAERFYWAGKNVTLTN